MGGGEEVGGRQGKRYGREVGREERRMKGREWKERSGRGEGVGRKGGDKRQGGK